MCEVFEANVIFEEAAKTNENVNYIHWESPIKVEIPEPEPVNENVVYNLMADETGGYDATVTPAGVVIVGTNSSVEELEKLVIPDTLNGVPVVAIEAMALWDCSAKEVVLPDSCLGFVYEDWNKYTIEPDYDESDIRSCLFISACESVPRCCEKVVLGANTELHSGIFYNCINLKEIVIPNPEKITEIEDYAFAGCRSLVADFEFPNLKVIERKAFVDCKNVKITLPDDMTKIAINLFNKFPKENVRFSNKLAERIGRAFLFREIDTEDDVLTQTLYLGKTK